MTQPFVDALTWVPKSRALGATLARAHDLTRAQAHPSVTLEHLMQALIEDPDASTVLLACNLDLLRLNGAVSAHLQHLPAGAGGMPDASQAVVMILEYAVAAARQSGRNEVNGAIVLAAIVGEGNNVAAKLLQEQGLTFEDAVRALKRASAPPRPAAGPGEAPPAAREPVREVAAPVSAPVAAAPVAMDQDPITTARRRVEAIRTGQPMPGAGPHPAAHPAAMATGAPQATMPPSQADWAPQPIQQPPPARPPRMPPPVPPISAPPSRPHANNGGGGNQALAPWTDANSNAHSSAGEAPTATVIPFPAGRIDPDRLADKLPQRMRARAPTTVEVRIARSAVFATAAVLGAAPEAALTRALSVRLKAPSGGFHVENASPETQWFDTRASQRDDDEVRWRWVVTPHASGHKPLQLALSMRTIASDGVMLETVLPEQSVSVRVSPQYGPAFRAFGGWAVAALAGALLALLSSGAWPVVIGAIGRWLG